MRILILDDELARHMQFKRRLIGHELTHVATADEAICALQSVDFHYAFLDHDLSEKIMQPSGKGTGYEVAVWIEEHPEHRPKNIVIHSFNPAGRKNMLAALPGAVECPGAWTMIQSEGGLSDVKC